MAATLLLQHACQHLHPRPNGEGEEPLPHGSGEGGELHAHPLGKLDPLLARLQAERNPFSLGHGGSLLLIARDLSRVEGRHLHFYGSRDILGLRQWGATNKGQDIEPWAPSWGDLTLKESNGLRHDRPEVKRGRLESGSVCPSPGTGGRPGAGCWWAVGASLPDREGMPFVTPLCASGLLDASIGKSI
jgi:hypothetical protein